MLDAPRTEALLSRYEINVGNWMYPSIHYHSHFVPKVSQRSAAPYLQRTYGGDREHTPSRSGSPSQDTNTHAPFSLTLAPKGDLESPISLDTHVLELREETHADKGTTRKHQTERPWIWPGAEPSCCEATASFTRPTFHSSQIYCISCLNTRSASD